MTVHHLYPNQDANEILERSKGKYENVFILGWDHDGELIMDTTDNWTAPEILWALEKIKRELLLLGDVFDNE